MTTARNFSNAITRAKKEKRKTKIIKKKNPKMKNEIPGTILSLTDFVPNTTRLPLHDLQIYLGCGKKKLIGIREIEKP